MTPFQKIPEACRTTGLSMYYLRKGCKDGTIPHIKSGPTYYINVPELLRQLNAEAQSRYAETGKAMDGEAVKSADKGKKEASLTHPPLVKCLRPNRLAGVCHNMRKKVKMMGEDKICPLLAIASAIDHDENLPPCLQDLCAWWLPEDSSQMPIKMTGGCCAMSTLVAQVCNIANK